MPACLQRVEKDQDIIYRSTALKGASLKSQASNSRFRDFKISRLEFGALILGFGF